MQDNSDLIIRDCCEAEVAEFGQPDTICITVDVLREIVQRHFPGTCLHQIQEPAAAEQAAWHAGLDEGRAQASPAAVAVADELAAFEDATWYWVEKEGWIGDPPTIAPALYKAEIDAWYSFAFSGIPTRQLKVLEPCLMKARAALAATPAAAPVALTIPQPFGYVVTTPAGADLFYRHPADLAIHNDHRAETVYTLPAVLAAAPVVLPEPVSDKDIDAAVYAQCPDFDAAHEGPSIDDMRAIVRALLATATGLPAQAFQQRVQPWMMACFGAEISADRRERNHRFLEEALELAQSCGCTASEAHQLVDYVYGRPWGEPAQEAGGVMVTLAALCLANGLDMHACGETELARIWTKVEAIRAKQAAKPKHSPLPEHAPQAQADARNAEITWPKARDVGRIGDMSQVAHIRVGFDSDNDVFVSVWGEKGGGSIEFCNPGGGGGGQSSRTRLALIALMVAMEADNTEKPSRDWWAQRAAQAAQGGE